MSPGGAESCNSCADACLAGEEEADLRQCIRLHKDCADICFTTARIAIRGAGGNEQPIRSTLEGCALACRLCADACRDAVPTLCPLH